MIDLLFYLLIFPGLLFTAVLGLVVGWVDRKVSARFQYRVGPPFFQNFNDFFKLLGKQTIIVKDSVKSMFISAPLVSFGTLSLLAMLIGLPLFFGQSFGGDIFVVMYLMVIHSVMVVLGGSSTGNVYSSLGAGREIKLVLADELIFIIVILIPIVASGYELELAALIKAQSSGAFIGSVNGVIGFLAGLLCMQAKMTMQPFDIPEAETEIVEGPLMEYSGPLLGFWKLNHFMMYVVYPFLLILLYLGGFNLQGWGILWAVLKYLLIVVLMIILKNTNPRLQIDTALKFFWKILFPVVLIGLILAVLGV
ncbi:MAG: NADH-quinone oxidoreductase subunit H [Candidatus Marinimicrobia bacterium]|nr:NADH-quinone oxidoreductase subunit H [Candidatus Neomarinimicrobiota bacterium]